MESTDKQIPHSSLQKGKCISRDSRLKKALNIDLRKRFYKEIENNPGISTEKLYNNLGYSSKLAEYYLEQFTKWGIIRIEEQKGIRRCYPIK